MSHVRDGKILPCKQVLLIMETNIKGSQDKSRELIYIYIYTQRYVYLYDRLFARSRGTRSPIKDMNHWITFISNLFILVEVSVEPATIFGWLDNRKMAHQCSAYSSKEHSKLNSEFFFEWFGLVFWHINYCRLFNAKSSLYIYVKYIWFGLVWFSDISTIVGYLMPNPLYTYMLNIYDLVWFGFLTYQLL